MISLHILIVIVIVAVTVAQFDHQYIGNSISLNETKTREYCEQKFCLIDADFLFYAATQNSSIEPCDDFQEFALGTFLKYRSINDRDEIAGFINDAWEVYLERLRKVLAKKVDNAKDRRMEKVLKNYFQRCVSSNYIEKNGVDEMQEYLNRYGIELYPSYDHSKIDIKKLFEEEFDFVSKLFLKHHLFRCDNIRGNMEQVLCLELYPLTENLDNLALAFEEMLSNMYRIYLHPQTAPKFREDFRKISRRQSNFYNLQIEAFGNFKTNREQPQFLKISELKNFTPSSLDLDWVKILNKMLLTNSSITEDSLVVLQSPEIFRKLANLLVTVEKNIVGEYFMMNFLLENRFLFNVYSEEFNGDLGNVKGLSKSPQRWQQCILRLLKPRSMDRALKFLYAQRYHDNLKAANTCAREAVSDVAKQFETSGLDIINATKIANHLLNMSMVIGYRNDILTYDPVESFYDELSLIGNETLVETLFALEKYEGKRRNDPQAKVGQLFDTRIQNIDLNRRLNYFPSDNVLHIPPMFVSYPFFHANRSRFFNTATLYTSVAAAIIRALKVHPLIITEKINLTMDPFQMGYENYLRWEKNGGQELLIGANRLSNHQLYWVALVRRLYLKINPLIANIESFQFYVKTVFDFYDFKNLNSIFKLQAGFVDAFQCSNESSTDKQ